MQAIFWPLVKQDLKGRKRRTRRMNKGWRIAYAVVLVIGIVAFTTYWSLNRQIDLKNVWLMSYGLPFFLFGISNSVITREWKNDTVDWWLSLPYSRMRLVTAKFTSSLLKGFLIFLAAFFRFLDDPFI